MLVVLREAYKVNGRPREGREVDEPQTACHDPYVGNRAYYICYDQLNEWLGVSGIEGGDSLRSTESM